MLHNIKEVESNIEKAAKVSGRNKEDITLIAVSKTKPMEMILEAKKYGLSIFGENKVQELVEKYDNIKEVKWHLIGHLQKNKIKYIIDKVDLIHSLDSLSLAEEINKRANANGLVVDVLIQVNIGKEESKTGIYEEDLDELIKNLSDLHNIKVKGLMAIPPKCEGEEVRVYFKKMKKLFDNCKVYENEKIQMKYLSMGMTGDYEIAIEEGSNMVRVGTGIFGARDYIK